MFRIYTACRTPCFGASYLWLKTLVLHGLQKTYETPLHAADDHDLNRKLMQEAKCRPTFKDDCPKKKSKKTVKTFEFGKHI